VKSVCNREIEKPVRKSKLGDDMELTDKVKRRTMKVKVYTMGSITFPNFSKLAISQFSQQALLLQSQPVFV